MDRLDRALLLIDQHRFELAAKQVTEALRVAPDDYQCHAVLSFCMLKLKRLDEAAEIARTAISMAPDQPERHFALACVEATRGKLKQALETLTVARPLASGDPDFWSLLSYTRARGGQMSQALDAAAQGLALAPTHDDCRVNQAVALIGLGRVDEADQALVSSLQNHPESSVNHILRGLTLLTGNRPKDALTHYQEALRLDPTNSGARRGTVNAARLINPVYAIVGGMAHAVRNFRARIGIDAFVVSMVVLIVIRSADEPTGYLGGGILMGALFVVDIFDIFGWTAQPLFTLPLMLRRRWRRYLTTDEIRAALVAGGWFVYGSVCVGLSIHWHSGTPLLGTLIAACVSVPSVAVFECRPGWRRGAMACFALTLAGFGLAVQFFAADNRTFFGLLILACLLGTHAAGWLGCLLAPPDD